MKKEWFKVAILTVAFVMVGFCSAFAQEAGDKAIGTNFVVGVGNNFTNMGIGAKFQYNVIKPIRGEGSFTYFFSKDEVSFWDLSVNAHYVLSVMEKVNVYPLAGLGLVGLKDSGGQKIDLGGAVVQNTNDGSYNQTFLGLNLGGGAEYKLTDQLYLNAELKYRIKIFDITGKSVTKTPFGNSVGNYYDAYADRLMLSIGLSYKF